MNNLCNFRGMPGIQKDCENFMGELTGFLLADPSQYFATLTAAKLAANVKLDIDTNLKLSAFRNIYSSEPTSPEEINESAERFDLTVGFKAPKVTVFMSSNECDFNEMVSLGAQNCRIYLKDAKGFTMATKTATGTIRGFEAQMVAAPNGPKNKTDMLKQYRVIINFREINEFMDGNAVIYSDGITNGLAAEYMPKGYTQEITSALSTASMSVKITKRCTNGLTLASGTWVAVIDESNCSAPVITVGALSAGVSVLTIYATGTTPLAAGQYIKFHLVQMNESTATIYDKITNQLTASL